MSKIHENNEEDDDYNSNYQSNLIDSSISSTLTDSLNTELAKIQKMRESGNNIPQNMFFDGQNNQANNSPNNSTNNNVKSILHNLENSNFLGTMNSSKNELTNYGDGYFNTSPDIKYDNNKLLSKLDYIIHLLEEQHNEKTNYITEELILYLFLGIFILFVLDSFARASKYVR